jgi:lysyl-tRNA synthetase class II
MSDIINTTPTNQNINTSTIESQRKLRVDKVDKLRSLGFDPYKVDSFRDCTIEFVKFWFDFTHKFDIEKMDLDENNYVIEHYLAQAIFPQTLVETMEEKIQLRHTARQMGIDPDDSDSIDIKLDDELINEIRSFIPGILQKTSDQKEKLLYAYLLETGEKDPEGEISEPDGLQVQLHKNQQITLAGRIKTKRGSGKIAFVVLEDESCPEGFQIVIKKDDLDNSVNDKMLKIFDQANIKQKLNLV